MSSRRHFLKAAGLASLGGVVACSPGQKALQYAESRYQIHLQRLKFPKLRVSMDRVVKETVGLRPFRTHGPRIEKEMLGSTTLVHNYGHGGSGWSLSWGSSAMAVELAEQSGEKAFAVLGAGVLGITTATLLQRKGYEVHIYTQDLPPQVTSSMATGTWSPSYTLIDEENITPEFVSWWEKTAQYSFRTYQNLLGFNDMITWMDAYTLDPGPGRSGGHPPAFDIPGLVPEKTPVAPSDHPFAAQTVIHQSTLVFNIPAYLQYHLDRFISYGGQLHRQTFERPEDIDALPQSCVINCMGLGAKKVFDDEQLIPVAGQLAFLIPQPEVSYRIMAPGGYSIPRKDGIVLGGTHDRGSWDTVPKREQTEKMVAALQEVVDNMRI